PPLERFIPLDTSPPTEDPYDFPAPAAARSGVDKVEFVDDEFLRTLNEQVQESDVDKRFSTPTKQMKKQSKNTPSSGKKQRGRQKKAAKTDTPTASPHRIRSGKRYGIDMSHLT